nr:hypothetical protein [Tanacetum cinerariifolium]
IINGDSPVPTVVVEGVVQPATILTADQKLARRNELKARVVVEGVVQPATILTAYQKLARRNELKARGTLLMALPDKHQLKFNFHKDAKTLMKAIEKCFGWNTETNLPSEWKTHTLIWRNKANLEEHILDDLFNSLRIYKAKVKHSSSPGNPTQNIAFVSSSNTDSTTYSVSAVTSISAVCAPLPVPQLDNEDLKQINVDDLEEMDLRWQMAKLTMRARRFLQKTKRNLGDNRATTMGFDMSKVECYNCHKKGHFTQECRSPKDNRRTVAVEPQRRHVPVETSTSNALVSQCDRIRSYDWSYQAEEEPANFALMAIPSSSSAFDNEVKSCTKACSRAYDELHSQYDKLTIDFRKSQFDVLSYQVALESVEAKLVLYKQNESIFQENINMLKNELSPAKPAQDISHTNRPMTPNIEDWVSDSEDESEPNNPQSNPSFVQTSEHAKLSGHSVLPVEAPILDATSNLTSSKTNGSSKRKNRKTCFVYRGVDHLIKDCNFHSKPKPLPTPRNSAHRGYDKQYASSTKKYPQKHIVPAATSNSSLKVTAAHAKVVSAAKVKKGNRVLVTKPQNETPYELLHGRTPSIGFMRPFGCPVTILNTLDSLGKFKGKVDEGFLVGYSVNSKAFRVFNSRTCIAQETLHVNFLENKPNVAGTGPTWLFDIDSLTWTMNYQPVTAGNQSNLSAEGDATFDGKEHAAEQPESTVNLSPSSSALSGEQDDITKKMDKGKSHVDYFTRNRDFNEDFEDYSEDSSNDVSAAGPIVPTAGQNYSNSTNPISVAESKDIVYSDHENVGAEVDFNNLETSITVSPIPTTRIHNAHPISQIIGNLSSTTQTRSMARINRDQGRISQILNEDFHTCMFACFLSQEEPKRVYQALKDPSWIEAMQEELPQFKMQKVYILVDLPHGKQAIGHTQEERTDYEEVFAPVARIEAIRLFLAYASFMGFMVYQMHVKSAFLYRTIEEEVYVCQPLGFEDPDHPDKVYKVVKIDQTLFIKKQKGDILLVRIYVDDIIFGELTFFMGLRVKQKEDGIFINQDKYVAEILKKFGLTKGKSASTSIDTEKPLLKDPDDISYCCSVCHIDAAQLVLLVKQSNDVTRIQALVDKKKVVVTEATIRDALYLDDAEGVDCLHNEEIFSTLARMEEQGAIKEQGNDNTAAEELVTVVDDVADQSIQSPTPLTPPPQQPQDIPSTSQVQSPPPQQQSPPPAQPQGAHFPMSLLQEALDACAALTRRVEHLEHDKVAQDLDIIKLKTRVKKLERANKVKTMKLRRLRKVGTSQRIESSDDTLMEDVSNQGRVIDKSDKDKDAQVEGRMADIYHIDMDHATKVLSMQEDEPKIQEAVEVVTTAKLITEVVAAVSETVSATAVVQADDPATLVNVAAVVTTTPPVKVVVPSTRRRRGVVIRDSKEESSAQTPTETKSKDKGKGIMVEEPKPIKKKQQVELDKALKKNHMAKVSSHEKIPQTEAQARRNMMVYLKNTTGFTLDFFKGMSYDDIRPIFEAKFNANMEFLLKSKEQLEEEESRAIALINETPAQKTAKRRRLNKETEDVEELK